jgi:hypothetical protein
MSFPAKTQSSTTPGATINFGVPAPSFNLASNSPATTSATGASLGGG